MPGRSVVQLGGGRPPGDVCLRGRGLRSLLRARAALGPATRPGPGAGGRRAVQQAAPDAPQRADRFQLAVVHGRPPGAGVGHLLLPPAVDRGGLAGVEGDGGPGEGGPGPGGRAPLPRGGARRRRPRGSVLGGRPEPMQRLPCVRRHLRGAGVDPGEGGPRAGVGGGASTCRCAR